MKRRNLYKIAMIIMTMFIVGILSVVGVKSVYADEIIHERMMEINPVYADVVSESDLIYPEYPSIPEEGYSIDAQEGTVYSLEEAPGAIREQLVKREENFNVTIKMTDDYSSEFKQIMQKAMDHTGVATEGDYISFQYGGWSSSMSGRMSGSDYIMTVTVNVMFYTTAAQEQQMDKAVDSALKTIDLSGNDYKKAKAIYKYICDNVVYDHTNLNDDSYKLKYTGYAALVNKTAVCQGYSVLFYRMALEAGLDARVVESSEMCHAWNIIKMTDGKYYCLDSTWDAGRSATSYIYFLKGSDSWLTKHTYGGISVMGVLRPSIYNPATGAKVNPQMMDYYDVPQTDYVAKFYSVRLYSNGGTGTAEPMLDLSYGVSYELPMDKFERPGYLLDGYNTNASGTGTAYKSTILRQESETGDVVNLYAQWKQCTNHSWKEEIVSKAGFLVDGQLDMLCEKCKQTSSRVIYQISNITIPDKYYYTGDAITPRVVLKDSKGQTLDESLYSVESLGEVNAGTAHAQITLSGDKYAGTWTASFKILKRDEPFDVPKECYGALGEHSKVSDVVIPFKNWKWSEEDSEKALPDTNGASITATAVYTGDDKDNFVNTEAIVTITMIDCEHTGYKSVENYEVSKAPTCENEGRGQYRCPKCHAVVENNIPIEALGHDWDMQKVTKATFETSGHMSRVCKRDGSHAESVVIEKALMIIAPEETSCSYNGLPQEPKVQVLDSKGNAISQEYYTVSYSDNIMVGEGKVVVAFMPDCPLYEGSETATFEITKANSPAIKPEKEMIVGIESGKTIGDVALIDNWRFAPEYVDVQLPNDVGSSISANAIYTGKDADCYEDITSEITIIMSYCEPIVRLPDTSENDSKNYAITLVKGGTVNFNEIIGYTGIVYQNKSVAVVSKKGQIKGKKLGTSLVYVTARGVDYVLHINVTQPYFSGKILYVNKGEEISAMLQGTGLAPRYTSAKSHIATVDSAGRVKGVMAGKTVMTAVVEGAKFKVKIQVCDQVITGKDVLTLGKNATYKIKNGAKLTQWSSSNPSVAVIDSKGKVVACGLGTTTITAVNNGKTVTKEIKVIN